MKTLVTVACGLLLLAATGLGHADDEPAKRRKELPRFTPEREAAALRFVERHHPELRAVLRSLEAMQADEYRDAIRELYAKSDRIDDLGERDPERARLMVEQWKVDSRIDLLLARAAATPDDAAAQAMLEAELADLVGRRFDLDRQRLELDRKRLKERLEKVEGQLERLDDQRETIIERRLQGLRSYQNRLRRKSTP